MYFSSFLIGLLAVEIETLVEWFVIHPYGIQSFFAIGFAQFRFDIHAFTFDELYFGVDFEDLLFGHDLFFLLDYWGGERFEGFAGGLGIASFDRTDPYLVDAGRKQIILALAYSIITVYFHLQLGK